MYELQPVFTEKAECQDCFKCVRNCPVKAIKVEQNSAVVIPEMCVACGRCVGTCPAGAKRIRNDIGRAKLLLEMNRRVFVSLAPSFASEFPGVRAEQLATAFGMLGFAGVSETALGAEQVSAHIRAGMESDPTPRLMISSACPTAVEMLARFHPHIAGFITPVVSPLLAHAGLLKRWFSPDAAVVFVGPCIAKKIEGDRHPDVIDAALTFKNLREWMAEEGLIDKLASLSDTKLVPRRAQGGALYPVDGGMIAGIGKPGAGLDAGFMSLSGVEQIREGLEGLDRQTLNKPLFVEALACEGGCVNGPGTESNRYTVRKRLEVLSSATSAFIPAETENIDMSMQIPSAEPRMEPPPEHAVREALQRVGKRSPDDELNCGGCGYESCRDFAVAMIQGKGEPAMCVSYMRRLAQNKANALIRAMPAGVIIIDESLRIVESNRAFAELAGEDAELAYEASPGLAGVELGKVLDDTSLFRQALDSGATVSDKDVRIGKRLCQATIFTVEHNRLIGAILVDVTQPAVHRGQIIRKAEDVIRKNLMTVQQIACLLGENAAESEMILNSIITSFSLDPTVEKKDETA